VGLLVASEELVIHQIPAQLLVTPSQYLTIIHLTLHWVSFNKGSSPKNKVVMTMTHFTRAFQRPIFGHFIGYPEWVLITERWCTPSFVRATLHNVRSVNALVRVWNFLWVYLGDSDSEGWSRWAVRWLSWLYYKSSSLTRVELANK